jgi:acetyl coenzyme A synthetase (ADP forming)-like protein
MAADDHIPDLEQYRSTVTLNDGSIIELRPISEEDETKVLELFNRISPASVYLTFHRYLDQMSKEEAKYFCSVDYENSFAFVAVTKKNTKEKIVATGRYRRLPKREAANVTLLIEDEYQKKGVGPHILKQLGSVAGKKGMLYLEAEVLEENRDMVQMFIESGFRKAEEIEPGIVRMLSPVAKTPGAIERYAEFEKIITIESLKAFLKPRSIAVIGASRRPNTIGNKLFHNLLIQNFSGVVYPVNPGSSSVASVKAYPTVLDIPGDIDLAVIMVPAAHVKDVIEQCGRKGVKGAIIISAGFREIGEEGRLAEIKLLETARNYGIRLVGPNCMGIINTDPTMNMNATFSSTYPPIGNIAMSSQSGALGLAILEYAQALNIGLSTFVSIGNRADISSNDLLQYWEDDPNTKVILLYLESFGNPRKFARLARTVSITKPIVVVKSGRTAAGSRAAASHTGALATAEVGSEALFAQAGIIRVDTLEELFDVGNMLSQQPLPRGRRVAILTNGGGPGIMTADALAERGLIVPPISEKTIKGLKKFLPPRASFANPIDMTAEATAEQYGKSLALLAEEDDIDIVIVIFIPPIITPAQEVAAEMEKLAGEFRRQNKILVASFMGTRGFQMEIGSKEEGYIPCFTFPESTATAISKTCDYADFLRRPKGTMSVLDNIDKSKAQKIVTSALAKDTKWLDSLAAVELLNAYGIRTVNTRTGRTVEEAVKAAEEVGFPVVMKLLSDTITHKTDVGGVVLDIRSKKEVEQAYRQIEKRLESIGRAGEMQGVMVQRMVSGGTEVIIGITQDPSFGSLILFGMGGTQAELFKDVTFRITPLTDRDTQEMMQSVKTYQLLKGWRGAKPGDIAAVEDLLLRVSAMAEGLPEISELDLNPVKVMEEGKGYVIVDARILLSPDEAKTDD